MKTRHGFEEDPYVDRFVGLLQGEYMVSRFMGLDKAVAPCRGCYILLYTCIYSICTDLEINL